MSDVDVVDSVPNEKQEGCDSSDRELVDVVSSVPIRRAPLFRHHAATQRFFARFAFLTRVPLYFELSRVFGVYSVSTFALVYFLSKGVSAHLLSSCTLPIFKDEFHVGADAYQNVIAVGVLAWSMKPIVGLISDSVAIWGFHKRWYLAGAASMGSALFLALASLPSRSATDESLFIPYLGAAVLFCANLCCAVLDLLPEGRYSQLIALRPESASAMVSWVWCFVMLGGAVAACAEGPLADAKSPRGAVLIGCLAQALLVFPLSKNWFGERNTSPAEPLCVRFNSEVVTVHRRISMFCFSMALCTILLAVATIAWSKHVLLVLSLTCGVLLVAASLLALPRGIAEANIFMFLKELLYVQLPGPLDYFYTADKQCVADGPHFSYSFYQSFTVIVGYVAGACGVGLFHKHFATKSFRYTFWMTTVIKVVASVVDIVIVKRWNRSIFGLDDHWSFFLGDAIVFGVCQMLDFMPAVVLTSRLCPPGIEATVYAVLAGFSNLGQALSNTVGSLLTEFVWPIRTTVPCDFSNLPQLLLVSHCVLPLLVVPLTFVLVPDQPVNEVQPAADPQPPE